MQKALLIAEKPSLEGTIEAVYRKHKGEIPYDITFTSLRGHLVTLKDPGEIDKTMETWSLDTLPFYPEAHGGWQYKVIKEKKQGKFPTSQERYERVSEEIQSGKYDVVIHAGDPDREGELLVRLVLQHIGNRLPVLRFWSNDLEESAVLQALKNLKDDDRDPMLVNLYNSALGRERADYLFGMNLSRAASLKMNGRANVGRVMTPVEQIVVQRELDIINFKPTTKYGVKAKYAEGFSGTLFDPAKSKSERAEEAAAAERDTDKIDNAGVTWFEKKEDAQKVIDSLPKLAETVSVAKKRTATYAPKLFNLAAAQVEGGKYHFSAGDTLKILQSLYEKKVLTYPRTDCEYISSQTDFRALLNSVRAIPEFAHYVDKITDADITRVRSAKRWINDKALQEAGHSGLAPTKVDITNADLTKGEQIIYEMVVRRFLAIFLPPLVQDRVELVTRAGDRYFRSAGKTLVSPGYTELFGSNFTDVNIPPHNEGDRLDVKDYTIAEKTTTKPKRYTTAELIAVLNAPWRFLLDDSYRKLGKKMRLGTPATQAPTIEKLLRLNYLTTVKEGKTERLAPTDIGIQIMKNLQGTDITKVDLTGEWEMELEQVRLGTMRLEQFEANTHTHVEKILSDIINRTVTELPSEKKKVAAIGVCPKCGKRLVESDKGFFCMGYFDTPKCTVSAAKAHYTPALTKEEFLDLVVNGNEIEKTPAGQDVPVKIKYFPEEGKIRSADEKTIGTCPRCGGKIKSSADGVRCTGGDFAVGRTFLYAPITDADAMTLIQGGKIQKALRKKTGGTWEQQLYYDFNANKIEFFDPAREGTTKTDMKCPLCKKFMEENEVAYSCSCGFKMKKNWHRHEFTREQAEELFTKKRIGPFDDFWSEKKQKTFPAEVVIDKKKKTIAFDFPKRK